MTHDGTGHSQPRRWERRGRRLAIAGGSAVLLTNALQASLATANQNPWLAAIALAAVVLALLVVWDAWRAYVGVSSREVDVPTTWGRRRIGRADVAGARLNASRVWADRVVLELHDGEMVRLPLVPAQLAEVERWVDADADA